jgi:hypothetical protein
MAGKQSEGRFASLFRLEGLQILPPPFDRLMACGCGAWPMRRWLERFPVDLSRDGDRKSRSSFDQGKPADCSGVGVRLESGKVNSAF